MVRRLFLHTVLILLVRLPIIGVRDQDKHRPVAHQSSQVFKNVPIRIVLPSGIPTTRPEGVVTRAAAWLLGWGDAIAFLSAVTGTDVVAQV